MVKKFTMHSVSNDVKIDKQLVKYIVNNLSDHCKEQSIKSMSKSRGTDQGD